MIICCKRAAACLMAVLLSGADASDTNAGAEVHRVILPERLDRGNTSIKPLSPMDNAAWISVADATVPPGGLFLRFRNDFERKETATVRCHVTADEQYVLLLDGEVVSRGPDRGDPNMWFFHSYDIRFTAGRHRLEAIVWKLNPGQSPNAQLSYKLGFAFAAEGDADKVLTTGRAKWKVGKLTKTVMTGQKYPSNPIGAQCAVNGQGLVDEEPIGWESPIVVRPPITASLSTRPAGWLLFPSQLPERLSRPARPGRCVAVDDQAFVTNGVHLLLPEYAIDEWGSNAFFRAESAADPRRASFDALLRDGRPLTVPAHTSVRFLWNLGDYYCAYPNLRVTGGKGAAVAWSWAESLYVGDCFDWHTVVTDRVRKGVGNRNEFVGKYFYGFTDVFRPTGGTAVSTFSTPWWRSGVFCLIEVKTGDEPLTLERLSLTETRYPFESEGYFHCSDPTLEDVQRICVRGLQMCMHDMHFDCPHYEQQMYGGDTRLQLMACQPISRDDAMNRQAFRLFEISQRDNGLVSMCYPTTWLQESVTFSQFWGFSLADYVMWRGNLDWVRARMPAVRRLLFGIERYVNGEGFLSNAPGWHFVDWVPDWQMGVAPGHDAGLSALDNLLYLLSLRKAETVERALSETELAARWRRLGDALARRVIDRFWDEGRGLVADTPDRRSFSEHAQVLAILADALTPSQRKRAAEGLASAPDLARCTASFASYLFEAYFACGRADLFLKKLDIWREYVRMGLHTPLEGPGDARSDCHGWSANPLHHLHAGLAGVKPAEPGCRSVRIAPQPGPLTWIKSKTAVPQGFVVQDLTFDGDRVTGSVELPSGVTGVFVWHGRQLKLVPGNNGVDISKSKK